jgi:hypothetical protein
MDTTTYFVDTLDVATQKEVGLTDLLILEEDCTWEAVFLEILEELKAPSLNFGIGLPDAFSLSDFRSIRVGLEVTTEADKFTDGFLDDGELPTCEVVNGALTATVVTCGMAACCETILDEVFEKLSISEFSTSKKVSSSEDVDCNQIRGLNPFANITNFRGQLSEGSRRLVGITGLYPANNFWILLDTILEVSWENTIWNGKITKVPNFKITKTRHKITSIRSLVR